MFLLILRSGECVMVALIAAEIKLHYRAFCFGFADGMPEIVNIYGFIDCDCESTAKTYFPPPILCVVVPVLGGLFFDFPNFFISCVMGSKPSLIFFPFITHILLYFDSIPSIQCSWT